MKLFFLKLVPGESHPIHILIPEVNDKTRLDQLN